MANEKFIWCRQCDVVHHVNGFDKAPVYAWVGGEVEERPADDWRHFMRRHEGHRLEPLTSVGEKYFPSGSIADPMSVAYVEVSNGRDRLLLRQSRKNIGEPVCFEPIAGRLSDRKITLAVQDKEIKKEMKRHFQWPGGQPPSDEKIDLFLEIFKDLVTALDPTEIEVGAYSQTDDNLAYGVLGPATIGQLLAGCARSFTPDELRGLRDFIHSHLDGCDVMSLVMQRQMVIEEAAQPQHQ